MMQEVESMMFGWHKPPHTIVGKSNFVVNIANTVIGDLCSVVNTACADDLITIEYNNKAIVVNYKAIAVDYKAVAVDYKTVAVDYKINAVDYKAVAVDYKINAVDYKAVAVDYETIAVDYKTNVVDCKTIVVDCKAFVVDYNSLVDSALVGHGRRRRQRVCDTFHVYATDDCRRHRLTDAQFVNSADAALADIAVNAADSTITLTVKNGKFSAELSRLTHTRLPRRVKCQSREIHRHHR